MDENLGGDLKRRLKYVEITKSSDVEMERLAGDLKIQNSTNLFYNNIILPLWRLNDIKELAEDSLCCFCCSS